MSSTDKKIVVFTATGDQGRSVCRYLLKAKDYEVVGVTRNTESNNAKELSSLGVKMVEGDMTDVSSYSAHLEGIHGAFVNADFWTKYWNNGHDGVDAGEWECKISSDAIDACVKAGAKHIVYSTLDDAKGICPHMDYKQKVSLYAKSKDYPVTDLYTSHYISNLVKFDWFVPQKDGSFMINSPAPDDCPINNYDPEQTGGWVLAIFEDPKTYIRVRVDACSETPTMSEWAEALSKATGKKIVTPHNALSVLEDREPLVKQGVPEEFLLNYLAFYKGLCRRDIAASKKVYPPQRDTAAWCANNKEALAKAFAKAA